MYEYLDNPLKHLNKLAKQITLNCGEETSIEILNGLTYVTGNEDPKEAAAWADKITQRLEQYLNEKTIIKIREECACVYTNKYSTYNKKYFKELRENNKNEDDYLKAVAKFLSGRPRIGKLVEFKDNFIVTYLGEKRKCGCFVVKGGWDKPPSKTWCRCCQGCLLSVYRFILPNKNCNMDIIETLATGGKDCVFKTWFT